MTDVPFLVSEVNVLKKSQDMGPECSSKPRPVPRPGPLRSLEPFAGSDAAFQRGAERRGEIHGQGNSRDPSTGTK